MKNKSNVKIILWDIETSLMKVNMFQMQRKYKSYIPYQNIEEHWHMLCASWKELGVNGVNSVSLIDDVARYKKDRKDDYHVVKTVADAIRDVDIIIAHNGDKFDLKNLNQRLIFHRLPPLPKIITIDTLKQARSIADFPSNSLNDLGHFLGVGKKVKHSGFDLWLDCLRGDEKAMEKMDKYCQGDVKLLEKIYLVLRPYMKNHPNVADVETHNCPKCNSGKMIKHKVRILASGLRKRQFQCTDCGTYHTPKRAESEKPLSTN
jgi:DNA polymerase elongation subunit (family B)